MLRQLKRKILKAGKWKLKMWYYTKGEAEEVAAKLRRQGKQTKISRDKNLNRPHGGKHIYDVWYR